MQKLHVLRSKVLPMLYHLLENSHCKQAELHRNNEASRLRKHLCYLPDRAANACVHLHRMYGGPGLPDLVLTKARMTIRTLTRAMNLGDEMNQITRKLIFKGKTEDEFIQAINRLSRSGLSELGKEVVMAMNRLEKFLGQAFSIESRGPYIGWTINRMFYKDPGPKLSRMVQKRGLAVLKACLNQGRFWQTLTLNPLTTRTIHSFHTKICDWRFAHAAHLNLIPVRVSFNWRRHEEQNCRRCQLSIETVNHVINNCYSSRRDVVRRNNESRDAFVDAIPKNLMVAKEQRFGNLQPDIIVQNTQTREAWIIDVKVSTESMESFSANQHAMREKYDSLRRAFSIHEYQTTVNTLHFGALGGL